MVVGQVAFSSILLIIFATPVILPAMIALSLSRLKRLLILANGIRENIRVVALSLPLLDRVGAACCSGCGAWLGPAMGAGAEGGIWLELVLLLGGKCAGGGGGAIRVPLCPNSS